MMQKYPLSLGLLLVPVLAILGSACATNPLPATIPSSPDPLTSVQAPGPAPAAVPTAPAAPEARSQTVAPVAPQAASPAPAPKPAPSPSPAVPPAQGVARAPVAAPAPAPQPPPALPPSPRPLPKGLGFIAYADGAVSIRRGSALLSGAASDIGEPIYPYDLVMTGPGSRVELSLGSASSGKVVVKISENSSFYLDTRVSEAGEAKTLIRVLAGSLAFKVDKLLGSSAFSVSYGGTVLGVRGTTFSLDLGLDGASLVSCVEGAVVCAGPDGTAFTSRPGTAVAAGPDGILAPRLIPPDKLQSNRSAWLVSARQGVEQGGADLAVRESARLAKARPELQAALAGLDSLGPSIAAWESILAAGRGLGPTERLEERKALASSLLGCLKALPAFELPYYRLSSLEGLRKAGLVLGGSQASLGALPGLMAEFASRREGDEAGLGRIRRALYVFSALEADSPLGEFFGAKAASLGSGVSLFEFGF